MFERLSKPLQNAIKDGKSIDLINNVSIWLIAWYKICRAYYYNISLLKAGTKETD